jgi:hypothetical protein
VDRIADLLARINTHNRSAVNRDRAYTLSYRTIRLTVGVLGVLLPILFIIGEAAVLTGGFHFRGSISAYYHSAMQDIFVGGLCVIGLLLATYMSGEPRSLDFRASLLAGIAVLGVVFFPTSRPELALGAPLCESGPAIPSCSVVERALGESQTAVVHGICAIVFILSLAIMSLLFAAAELVDTRPSDGVKVDRSPVFALHVICAAAIVLAGIWAIAGGALNADLGEITPLYVGEVVAIWAFGISWLVAGFGITAPPRRIETILPSAADSVASPTAGPTSEPNVGRAADKLAST